MVAGHVGAGTSVHEPLTIGRVLERSGMQCMHHAARVQCRRRKGCGRLRGGVVRLMRWTGGVARAGGANPWRTPATAPWCAPRREEGRPVGCLLLELLEWGTSVVVVVVPAVAVVAASTIMATTATAAAVEATIAARRTAASTTTTAGAGVGAVSSIRASTRLLAGRRAALSCIENGLGGRRRLGLVLGGLLGDQHGPGLDEAWELGKHRKNRLEGVIARGKTGDQLMKKRPVADRLVTIGEGVCKSLEAVTISRRR